MIKLKYNNLDDLNKSLPSNLKQKSTRKTKSTKKEVNSILTQYQFSPFCKLIYNLPFSNRNHILKLRN